MSILLKAKTSVHFIQNKIVVVFRSELSFKLKTNGHKYLRQAYPGQMAKLDSTHVKEEYKAGLWPPLIETRIWKREKKSIKKPAG